MTQSAVATEGASDAVVRQLAQTIASSLNLNDARTAWILDHRVPELAVRRPNTATSEGTKVSIGRVALDRAPAAQLGDKALSISRTFAMTKSALALIERVAVAVCAQEAVLLVGETGTGKTTAVQHLASLLRRPFTALNLSQQSESSDLLGGFKPVEARSVAMDLHNDWVELFTKTFSAKRNAKFIDAERKAVAGAKWPKACTLWEESVRLAKKEKDLKDDASDSDSRKRQKTGETSERRLSSPPVSSSPSKQWAAFAEQVQRFRLHHLSESSTTSRRFNFAFVEGPLVQAIRKGEWILLDEINLASDETLDFLSALLQSSGSSITLTERGDVEAIPRHPDFRLFACMNPATDTGKKSLPPAMRARFTEFYVKSPDSSPEALRSIVDKYIGEICSGDKTLVDQAAQTYTKIKNLARNGDLADGGNQRPHFSIRTLARALTFCSHLHSQLGVRRSLYEGFLLTFTMGLDQSSSSLVASIIHKQFIQTARNPKQIMTKIPAAPTQGEHIQLGPFWLRTGSLIPEEQASYILTPSVHDKLLFLARAVAIGRFPVLIQGPTSAGKTSSIEYLAKRTGHRFVRINNHEHTDLQEYLGAYNTDPETGRLRFQEGLLVQALRQGHWIVLDELNLAPTDVLEALNRLLDDNRELVIPETGEVIRPHPHFMLFATQNPPGLYGGRKILSRAFRNRFLEAHFDDVPADELEVILSQRCSIPPSYAAKVVAVFGELQRRRQSDRLFESKHSFATLRDLFRWGFRQAVGYEQLAENGYMLLAERSRTDADKAVVQSVIEQVMRVKLDLSVLYKIGHPHSVITRHLGEDFSSRLQDLLKASGLVPTSSLQRLISLQCTAFAYKEPFLLVGEPGTGKTAVCSIVSKLFERELSIINCHQNTDATDLLGGQRPLRNRRRLEEHALKLARECAEGRDFTSVESAASYLAEISSLVQEPSTEGKVAEATRALQRASALFEWYDGPLILSMLSGGHVLLDEISLADDSVLERLNSLFESTRSIVLPNRQLQSSGTRGEDGHYVEAQDGFQIAATMNPGGDYGKKELSPALRNRFTEVWVPQIDSRQDLMDILVSTLAIDSSIATALGEAMIDFVHWLSAALEVTPSDIATLRDYLTWASFSRSLIEADMPQTVALTEGAEVALLQGLRTLPILGGLSSDRVRAIYTAAVQWFADRAALSHAGSATQLEPSLAIGTDALAFGPYTVSIASAVAVSTSSSFAFSAQTTLRNAFNVARALQIPHKSILLEGSPGAGKTSLIAALAAVTRRQLVRINLSEQTEVSDLFGSELPVENGKMGEFAWRDAAFLSALKEGHW